MDSTAGRPQARPACRGRAPDAGGVAGLPPPDAARQVRRPDAGSARQRAAPPSALLPARPRAAHGRRGARLVPPPRQRRGAASCSPAMQTPTASSSTLTRPTRSGTLATYLAESRPPARPPRHGLDETSTTPAIRPTLSVRWVVRAHDRGVRPAQWPRRPAPRADRRQDRVVTRTAGHRPPSAARQVIPVRRSQSAGGEPGESVFGAVPAKYFGGVADEATVLRLLLCVM